LDLNSEEMFDLIDEYKLGYLSPNMLSRYLQKQCYFKIQDKEISHLLDRYDKHYNYRIKREDFTEQVSPPQQEDEEHHDEEGQ